MKQFLVIVIVAASVQMCSGQNLTMRYFEVYTKLAHPKANTGFSLSRDTVLARLSSVPDSAGVLATFVIGVNDPGKIDSMYLTLTNSQGQIAYNAGLKLGAVQGTPDFKIIDKTAYFTVGPFPNLKHFQASVKLKAIDGFITQTKSFSKN